MNPRTLRRIPAVKYAFACTLEILFTVVATYVILEGPHHPAGFDCGDGYSNARPGGARNSSGIYVSSPVTSAFSSIEKILVVWVIGQMLYEAGQLLTYGLNR
jgi:hypothetical protein